MAGKPIPPKPSSPTPTAPAPGTSPASPPKPAVTPNSGATSPQKSSSPETYAIQKQPPISPAPTTEPPKTNPPAGRSGKTKTPKPPARLVSLDAYRGFIMMMLAASGFGISAFAKLDSGLPVWQVHNHEWWKALSFHFDHPVWISAFDYVKVSFWDLIQPAFMFMVGVSMPFSYARREQQGHGWLSRAFHALCRSIILVLLGVFLSTGSATRTVWVFPNVLCQIGLGYFFAWLLLNQKRSIQFAALAVLLATHWTWFKMNPPPADYDYAAVGVKIPDENTKPEDREIFNGPWAAWSKNGNIAFRIDQKLLPMFRTVPPKEASEETPEENGAPKASLPRSSRWLPVSLQEPPATAPGTANEPGKGDEPAKGSETARSAEIVAPEAATTDEQPPSKAPAPVIDEPAKGEATETQQPQAAGDNKQAAPEATTPLPPAAEPESKEPPQEKGPSWIRRVLFSNPEPYTFNSGGYTTLNFVPSIGTTLLGIICGQWLMSNSLSSPKKLGLLVLLAAICFGLGIGAHMTICPVVKRIWTPSWVLFSGGYVIGMLALFYLVFDIAPLRLLAFPLVVVGTNSILTYMMGQLIGGWTRSRLVAVHLSGFIETVFGPKALDPEWYAPIVLPSTSFLLFWLFLLWLYRQKIFLRI